MKILVCEDDLALANVLKKRLTASGFRVETASDGEIGFNLLQTGGFDVVISDIMMPNTDGLQLLKKIRSSKYNVPVILLTALDGSNDKVKGLDLGADDYIVKPFDFQELLARIRLVTRRNSGSRDNNLSAGDLVIDTYCRTVKRANKNIELSAKEFDLLTLLVKNKNIVLTREKICDYLYNSDEFVESNAIDVYIRYLRKKIDDDFEKKLIKTVRGVGYTIRED